MKNYKQAIILLIGIILVITAAAFVLKSRKIANDAGAPVDRGAERIVGKTGRLDDLKCEAGWKQYDQPVIGLQFCYPESWGEPQTAPVEDITRLKEVGKGQTAYPEHVGIGFFDSAYQTSGPGFRIFAGPEDDMRFNSEADAPLLNDLETLLSSGDVCRYTSNTFHHRIGDWSEVWSDCRNGVRVALVEESQYFDFGVPGPRNSYWFKGWAYRKLQNGTLDNLIVEATFDAFSQITESLTGPDDFFSGAKTGNTGTKQPKIGPAEFAAKRAELEKMVATIRTFAPEPRKRAEFKSVAGENPDLTAIRKYYWLLDGGQLREAYALYAGQGVDFAEYESWYKDVYAVAEPRITDEGNHVYEIFVDYQDHNRPVAVYHVTMQVAGGKIKTLSSEEITTWPPARSGSFEAFAKTKGGRNYMVLAEGERETVINQGGAEYDTEYANINEVRFFVDPVFSPSGRYLRYGEGGWESYALHVYDIRGRKDVLRTFNTQTFGFTEGERYFYDCDSGGMMSGGGDIFELPSGKQLFNLLQYPESERYGTIECEYVKDSGYVSFRQSEYYPETEGGPTKPDREIRFDLTTGKSIEVK